MNQVATTGALREIWVSSQQGSAASCAYNESFTIHIHGKVDRSLLQEAILKVAARHDALSAVFSNDGTVMKTKKFTSFSISNHDINSFSEKERTRYFKKLLEWEAVIPFDLENGPLWRAHLVTISNSNTKLVFTAHHLVCDGWSINILVREIGLIYDSLRLQNVTDPETPASFFSFAEDFIKSTGKERRSIILDFWNKQLTAPLPVLDLPVDQTRPPRRTYKAHSKRCLVATDLVDKVKKFAVSKGCNLFSYLLGAYALLLHKLSGNEDIIVGVPVAGQSYSGKTDVVGHCVTMLPLRISIHPDSLFPEFAANLQDLLFDAYDHHEMTFGDLIRELNIPRDPSRIPLVSVGFTYAKLHSPGEFGFDGLYASYSINERHFETFEIYATIIENRTAWELLWHFNQDLFKDSTAQRWMDAYQVLLNEIVNNAHLPIRKLSIFTETERNAILEKWNTTDQSFDFDETFVDMFEQQVMLTPQAVALEVKGKTLTYQELNNRAEKLACYLLKSGAGPDIPIGFCLNRSFEMVISLLGILKSGSAYIPIDPTFPDERISFILQDAEAKIVVTTPDISKRFTHSGIEIINPDRIPDVPYNPNRKFASGKHCAYIIYTSGSTGKPKGVEIRHFSLANFLISMKDTPGMTAKDTLLAVTTISFDIAGLEILCPLICGAKVYLAENELAADAFRLAGFIKDKKPSILQATPATWSMLLDTGWKEATGMKLLCGGEAMTRTLADRLLSTGAEVWNMYGPTETTIWSSVWKVTPGVRPPTIGQPVANTKLHILDADMSLVPTGVTGELYISGIGLARGYHNRPELTTEKFVINPFPPGLYSSIENRIYKTGDLARRLEDGTVEVLGRSDFQLKIRGFRIEPGEIEAALAKHKSIKESVVIDDADTKGNKILVAYVVFHEKRSVPVADLRTILRHSLPEYMIPTIFIPIVSIPRLQNNKIDRKSLPKPGHDRIEIQKDFVMARTSTEHYLLSVWKEVLGLEQISIDDNFFEIGGHSLLAVQIFIHIQQHTGFDLPLSMLFASPTIRELADKIDEFKDNAPTRSMDKISAEEKKELWRYIVPIQPKGSRTPFFCVHGVGGNVLHYKQMVNYLDKDQPMYGIQCRGLDGIEKPFFSIREMAATYLAEIRRIQPSGPYILGGGSMGGVAAFEIAQQLTRAGEKIDKLIMFDSIYPKGLEQLTHVAHTSSRQGSFALKKKHDSLLQKIIYSIWCRFRDYIRMKQCDLYYQRGIPIPHELRYWMLQQKHIEITERYVSTPYQGVITFFRAQQNYGCGDPYRGWQQIAKGGITFYDFSCSHENAIEHEELQKKLGEILQENVTTVVDPALV